MKKRFLLAAVALLGALGILPGITGCSTPWGTVSKNKENSRSLRVGMTKSEVLEVMGEPIRDESFCTPDLWYYYIEMVWGDGLVTEDECMPLVFENGKLVGWGNDFLVNHRLARKNAEPIHNPEPDAAKPEETKTPPKSFGPPAEKGRK